jgi:D-lactate dehydrogenase
MPQEKGKRIAVFSAHEFEIPYLEQANNGEFELVFEKGEISKQKLRQLKDISALSIFSTDTIGKTLIAQLKKMEIPLIATRSAGFEHIDLEAAGKADIQISNVPEYSPQAIAEHSLGLMLALLRKLVPSYERINNYDFSLNGLVGSEITGKTVGIMGVGNIGKALIKILGGFDCRIVLYDVEKNPKLERRKNLEYVTLDQLLKSSDIVSVHLPLNQDTKHIIDKESLKKMKSSTILINAGRGGLVDTKAVVSALKKEKLGGFGMDVYEHEDHFFYEDHSNEVFKDDVFARLLTFKNVFITAHQAFLTDTALNEIAETTFETIRSFLKDRKHINTVNADI